MKAIILTATVLLAGGAAFIVKGTSVEKQIKPSVAPMEVKQKKEKENNARGASASQKEWIKATGGNPDGEDC